MSEEQVSGAGLVRRSREEADAIVREYRASGLSRRAFCAAKGLALSSLDWYCSRRRNAARTPASRPKRSATAPRWVKVEAASGEDVSRAMIRVVCGDGLRIEVLPGFDGATLRRVIELLGSE
jgi:hypothetical protein